MRVLTTNYREFILYGIVVSVGLCVDLGLLFFLTTYTDMWYLAAAGISFFIALCTNYLLATRIAFLYRSAPSRFHEFSTFLAVGVSALILNQIVLYVGVDIFDAPVLLSKCIALPLTFSWNFSWNKFLLFYKRDDHLHTRVDV
jgi:putative flippase GtrA